MKILKTLIAVVFVISTAASHAQSDETKGKENSSKETVTKIIRIKGANGEEKVIKKQEVITKKSEIKFNPDDENKTNQSATYTDEEVAVEKSHTSSDMESYTITSDDKGFIITLLNKSGNKVTKVRPLSNGYYIVNSGDNNNCIGHFDKDKNLILETYDSETDEVISTVYKAN
ncbi:hypothetical protein [Aquimarina sediminis]|uniref:hypothetical protein n=1 Tax=Aquimarina sediminis TaxID=2070536 RepID=UPI000CA07877|nr:hypothetical protein [Aquimarina sediminis]